MAERDYKVLRCNSKSKLNSLLRKHEADGWTTVGDTEVFDGEFVQPIKITFDLDDTLEITEEVTQKNIEE